MSKDSPLLHLVSREQPTSHLVASTLKARPSLRAVSARWRPTTLLGLPPLDTGPHPQPPLTTTRGSLARRLWHLEPHLTFPLLGTHPLHTGAHQQVTAVAWEPHHW